MKKAKGDNFADKPNKQGENTAAVQNRGNFFYMQNKSI